MNRPSFRLRDFAEEAQARLPGAITYTEAELQARSREAFAAGEAKGHASAQAEMEKLEAGRKLELEHLLRDAARVHEEADRLVAQALTLLERSVQAALAAAIPGSAQAAAVDQCLTALRECAVAVRLPAIEVQAIPSMLSALQAAEPRLPDTLRLSADPTLPDGCVRISWPKGGATVAADGPIGAVESAVAQALSLDTSRHVSSHPQHETLHGSE